MPTTTGISAEFRAFLDARKRFEASPTLEAALMFCMEFDKVGRYLLGLSPDVPWYLRVFTDLTAWEATKREVRDSMAWLGTQGKAIQQRLAGGEDKNNKLDQSVTKSISRAAEIIARASGAFEAGRATLRRAVSLLPEDIKTQAADVAAGIGGVGVPILLGVAFLIIALKR